MKILAVLPRLPYPLEKGDKLRAYHLLKALAARHEVYLFALSDKPVAADDVAALETFCKAVRWHRLTKAGIAGQVASAFFSGRPLQAGYFYHPAAHRALKAFAAEVQPDHLYFQLVRTARYAEGMPPVPKTLDYMDAFAQGMARRALRSYGPLRWLWQMEAGRLARMEQDVFGQFALHTVISAQDRSYIHHPDRDQIRVLTNGIDLKAFTPRPSTAKDIDLIFTGNMSYPPNVLAAEYLVQKVLPLLLPTYPNLRLALAGTNPHKRVRALAGPQVEVTGWVDEISAYYARARVLVAPMEIGAGLQNKLLEALAVGLPCLTSRMAQQAMDKATALFVLTADNPQDYAAQIASLLDNPSVCEELGKQGRAYVEAHHNWGKLGEQLGGWMEQCGN